MAGWLALFRKFEDHEDWREPRKFSRAETWFYMLMKANWQTSFNNFGEEIPAGCFETTIAKLAHDWQWPETSVRRWLQVLSSRKQVGVITARKRTLLRLNNWETYQAVTSDRGAKVAGKRRNNGGSIYKDKQETTNKEQEDKIPRLRSDDVWLSDSELETVTRALENNLKQLSLSGTITGCLKFYSLRKPDLKKVPKSDFRQLIKWAIRAYCKSLIDAKQLKNDAARANGKGQLSPYNPALPFKKPEVG